MMQSIGGVYATAVVAVAAWVTGSYATSYSLAQRLAHFATLLAVMLSPILAYLLLAGSGSKSKDKKPSNKKQDLKDEERTAEELGRPSRLVDMHTSLGYLYLTVRGIAFDVIGIVFNNVIGAPFVPESLQDWLGVHPSKSVTYEQRTGKAGPHLGGGFEAFYKRRMYGRIRDCWGRPVAGCSGDAWIEVLRRERVQGSGWWRFWERDEAPLTFVDKDDEDYEAEDADPNSVSVSEFKTRRCLNLGSYNYLGFGGAGACTSHEASE